MTLRQGVASLSPAGIAAPTSAQLDRHRALRTRGDSGPGFQTRRGSLRLHSVYQLEIPNQLCQVEVSKSSSLPVHPHIPLLPPVHSHLAPPLPLPTINPSQSLFPHLLYASVIPPHSPSTCAPSPPSRARTPSPHPDLPPRDIDLDLLTLTRRPMKLFYCP